MHNSLYHSATTICGPNVVEKFANATFWAYVDTYCAIWDSTAA